MVFIDVPSYLSMRCFCDIILVYVVSNVITWIFRYVCDVVETDCNVLNENQSLARMEEKERDWNILILSGNVAVQVTVGAVPCQEYLS